MHLTVLYKYMKSLRNDVHNLSANAHVRRKISQEFYHDIVDMYIFLYIANEGCHIRINNNPLMDNYSLFNLLFLFSIYYVSPPPPPTLLWGDILFLSFLSVRLSVTQFVSATPLKLLNRIS